MDSVEQPEYNDFKNTELRILSSMDYSPFVSQIYDAYSDPRNLYLFSELGHCGTLQDLIITRGPLNARACQFFFANIIAALEFIHSQGVVHRDLKPQNMFLGADGYLMLGDFGVATREDDDKSSWKYYGTLPYGPPETVGALKAPRNTRRHRDWWAAACILFEMACQQCVSAQNLSSILSSCSDLVFVQAFPNVNALRHDRDAAHAELKERIGAARFHWPRDLEVDADLKDLVNRMLVKEPCDRFGVTIIPEKKRALTPQEKVVLKAQEHAQKDPKAKTPVSPEPPRRDHINTQLREHPFMISFPWGGLLDRTLIVSIFSTVVPCHDSDDSAGTVRAE